MIMSARTLALFLGSLLIVSWGIQAAALVVVGDVHADEMTPWLVGMMFVPTIWSVAYLTLFNRSAWKEVRFRTGNPLYLVLAALIPAALAFSVLGVVLTQNWGVSSFFEFTSEGANVLRGPWVIGAGEQGWSTLVANVIITAILFACINGAVAVGEEFGWRGVLQHHLIGRLGFLRGVTLLGIVWAMWHAPMNLAGYNHADMPILGTFVLFPIQEIAVSFIMAWLTIRADSFWPAVLMHGSGNGIQEGVMSSLTLTAEVPPLAAELIMLGATVALAALCIVFSPRPRNSDPQALHPQSGTRTGKYDPERS